MFIDSNSLSLFFFKEISKNSCRSQKRGLGVQSGISRRPMQHRLEPIPVLTRHRRPELRPIKAIRLPIDAHQLPERGLSRVQDEQHALRDLLAGVRFAHADELLRPREESSPVD